MRETINALIMHETQMIVQQGPFKGMQIVDLSSWRDGDISPKLPGTYEEELHPFIEASIGELYAAIVVVGCAEGYYAVGLARLFPHRPVYAFDIAPEALEILKQNAALNDVTAQIVVDGECTAEILTEIADRHGRILLISDCEGYEVGLFSSPSVLRSLRRSDILVECHDQAVANATAIVLANLFYTHLPEIIYPAGRNPNKFPFLAALSDLDRWLSISEGRPYLMNWIVARSRTRI